MLEEKYQKLRQLLSSLKKVLVAFSGGVDSTFLLYVSKEVLGRNNVLAVIAESPTYPKDEIELAKKLAQALGVDYQVIKTEEFLDQNFVSNPNDRCFYCKRELFMKLNILAKEKGFDCVVDGSNLDDLADYRPGSQAKQELGVRSPLQEAGLRKEEIRQLSKTLGLSTWDKPAYACLASRIPYGTKITQDLLARIEEGEKFLRSLGFKQLRVRHHASLVRIEVENDDLGKIMSPRIMDEIAKKFEELGYTYVTLDLKGYRTGSMNETLAGVPDTGGKTFSIIVK